MPLSSLALFKSGSVVLSARQRTELPSLPVGEATPPSDRERTLQLLVRPFYAVWRWAGSMNLHIVSVELHRTLYAICLLDIVCAATLTVTRIQWLTSSLLCNDTQQLIQRIREKKRATGLRKGSSCVLVLISVRRYANCARWKKFYKNVALSA